MRSFIKSPCNYIFTLLFSLIVSTLYAQGNSGNSAPSIQNVKSTNKSVCPTSTIDISFILQNGKGSSNSGAYFTTATEFTISLIHLDLSSGNLVKINNGTFSLSATEIPSETNEATSLTINRTFTIPINTATRSDYRIELTSNNPVVSGSDLSRSSPFTISDNNYWSGAINSDWNIAGNWDCDLIPSFINNAVVNNVLTTYPILNIGTAGECKDLFINSGSSLNVIDNTLNISGTISSNGNFEASNGTVVMMGSNSQTIPANTFVSNRIENLIINNINGVSSLGDLEITGFLRVDQNLSTFDTGNMLTLISDATQTALIDGSGNGDIIGTVKMQRYLDTTLGYKYFSSPFNNSTVGDFSSYIDLSATFPQVYEYNENSTDGSGNDSTGWNTYTDAAALLGALEGYAFNFGPSGNTVTVELIGTVNNGDLTRQISNTNGTYTKGFNLVGNPYPSPINWDAPEWTKTNIDDGIYFFSATDQYKGTYTSYVNKISSVDASSSNIIPSMQGFFVHVSDGGDNSTVTNGILALTNDVRVNDFNQQFIKRSEPAPVSLIRLSAGIKSTETKDALVIYFDPFAKESFEKNMDALKLMNTDENVPNLYSLTSNKEKLSINALPESIKNTNRRIPLGIRSEIDGEMSIQLKDLKNLPSNFNVYLIDEVKRIGQNLSKKPEYHFYSSAGEFNSRFYLLFSENELSDPALAFNEPFSVKTLNGKVMVLLNLDDGTSGSLIATTVTGQLLEIKSVTGKETISLEGIKSSGIYFINLSWRDQHFSKKIMIQK